MRPSSESHSKNGTNAALPQGQALSHLRLPCPCHALRDQGSFCAHDVILENPVNAGQSPHFFDETTVYTVHARVSP
jgi:hypothetical protein